MKVKEMSNTEAIGRISQHMLVHRMAEPHALLITQALEMGMEALAGPDINLHTGLVDCICGNEVVVAYEVYNGTYVAGCAGCYISVFGDTAEEVKTKWNKFRGYKV